MDCSPPGSSVRGIFRQEYWNELPFPPPGDLPNLEIEPRSPALQANSLPSEPPGKPNAWPYLAAKESGKCLKAECKVAPGICY